MIAKDLIACIRTLALKVEPIALHVHEVGTSLYGCFIITSIDLNGDRTRTEFRKPGVIYREYEVQAFDNPRRKTKTNA